MFFLGEVMRLAAGLACAFLVASAACPAAAGSFTTIYKFAAATGENPFGNLVEDANGAFYGIAYFFGPDSHGVVYRLTRPRTARPNGPMKSSIASRR